MRRDVVMFTAVSAPWLESAPLAPRSLPAHTTLREAPPHRSAHAVQLMPAFEVVVRPRAASSYSGS